MDAFFNCPKNKIEPPFNALLSVVDVNLEFSKQKFDTSPLKYISPPNGVDDVPLK